MDIEIRNKLKEHIGGRGDNYAVIIAGRLLEAKEFNLKGNPFPAEMVRMVFSGKRKNKVIESFLVALFEEREAEFEAHVQKSKSLKKKLGIQTKKSEADTSDSK